MGLTDSKLLCQFRLCESSRIIKFLDCFRRFVIQFFGVQVSNWSIMVSSFFDSIKNIISIATNEEMIWIYTRRVIAMMKNTHSDRNISICQKPNSSMRSNIKFQSPTDCDNSIAKSILGASPYPAFTGLFYLFPKSLFKAWLKVLISYCSGANLSLHNKFVLLCRAPGCLHSAGATCLKYAK